MLLSHFDVCIASASGFPYAEAELSVPSFPPQHMRKPWAQYEHAVISMQIVLLHVEFQLCTEHFLPVSALFFVLGRWQDKQSSAVKGSKAPPCNWRWYDELVVLTAERESLFLPQYNSHSHPLKQEFPKPFIQYNKRCKEFFAAAKFSPVQNSLPLGEHPWRFNFRRVLAAEL